MSKYLLVVWLSLAAITTAHSASLVDSYVATPAALFSSDSGGELADGIVPPNDFSDPGWSQYWANEEIVFTLNDVTELSTIGINYMNVSVWEVGAPQTVVYSFSTDGVTYGDAVTVSSGFGTSDDSFTVTVDTPVTCKYVKATITGTDTYLFLGEFIFSKSPAYTTTPLSHPSEPDSGGELVDDFLPTDPYDAGWSKYYVPDANLIIDFNFGEVTELGAAGIQYFAFSAWSLDAPQAVHYSFSLDGVNYGNEVTLSAIEQSDNAHFAGIDLSSIPCKYVRAEIVPGPNRWISLGECTFTQAGQKSYTANPPAHSSDPDSGGELVDDFLPTDPYDAGWSQYYVPNPNLEIIVNLNETTNLNSVGLHYYVFSGWSMSAPQSVTYSFSMDGVIFSNPVSLSSLDNSDNAHTAYVDAPDIECRYVKAEIEPAANGWVRLGELLFSKRGELTYTTNLTPYPTCPDSGNELSNGFEATNPYDADWSEYDLSLYDLVVDFELNDTITLSEFSLRYFVQAAWNFQPPGQVELTFSSDGINYGNSVVMNSFGFGDGAHTSTVAIPDVTCKYVRATLTPGSTDYLRLSEFTFFESGVDYDLVPTALSTGIKSFDDPYQIVVVFNNSVMTSSGTNRSNYKLDDNFIVNAVLSSESDNCVYITVAKPLNQNEQYILNYRNIASSEGKVRHWRITNPIERTSIASEAEDIMLKQLPNGAYNMSAPANGTDFQAGDSIWINPSFAHSAAQALLLANEVEPNAIYLSSVLDLLEWHADNLNPDGTIYDFSGIYPTINSTGDYDSSDAYAAGFIQTAYMYYKQTENVSFLNWVWPHIITTVGAMDLTLEADGLTRAKPSVSDKFLMDNSEVWIAYHAAAYFASLKSDITKQQDWSTKAVNNLAGQETMYLGDATGRYAYSKQGSTLLTDWNDVYPHGDSQIIAIRNVLNETNPVRANKVWQTTIDEFIPNGKPAAEIDGRWVLASLYSGEGDSVYRDICYANHQRQAFESFWASYIVSDYLNLMVMQQQIVQENAYDLNLNGKTDFNDFFIIAEKWQMNCQGCAPDITGDGMVNVVDLAEFVKQWLANDIWWD